MRGRELRGIVKSFSIVVFVCYMAAAGTALALPTGIADTKVAVTNFKLDKDWTGTVTGTLSGRNESWYTGYSFSFMFDGTTYYEDYSFCVDPADATLGFASNYYIVSLKSLGSDILTKYAKAAWLLNRARLGYVNEIIAQAAVWEIMFDGYNAEKGTNGVYGPQISDFSSNVNTWKGLAESSYSHLNLDGFYLAISPSSDVTKSFGEKFQDFIFYDAQPVPEPSTILFLGSGLVSLVAFRKKFRA